MQKNTTLERKEWDALQAKRHADYIITFGYGQREQGYLQGFHDAKEIALENLTKLVDHRTPECRHHESQYCVLCDTKLVEK